MGLFLQILGVVFLSLIILFVIAALVIRSKFRRFVRSLEELQRLSPGPGGTVPDGPRGASDAAIDVSFTPLDGPASNPPTP